MAFKPKAPSPVPDVPEVTVQPSAPVVVKPFVPSLTVNKAQLRAEFAWRLAAGLTALQALDTALAQIEKDEADANKKA